MAERRMFAKSIVSAGKFLRMPPTARLLYYDLGMSADDDGVVEAFSVMTQTRATEDDLRVLIAKGYINILTEDLVAYICDWNCNNSIRSDRYHPGIYKDLLVQFKEQTDLLAIDNQLATTCQPNDNQMDTEVRLGKVSLDKDSKKRERFIPPTVEEVREYCQEKGYNVDPELFVAYYDSNNWMIGKTKMKKWQSAVVTWVKRDADKPKPANKPVYSRPAYKQYETDDIDLSIFEE